jgi:hypothetical protein
VRVAAARRTSAADMPVAPAAPAFHIGHPHACMCKHARTEHLLNGGGFWRLWVCEELGRTPAAWHVQE